MRILILNGSPHKHGNTAFLTNKLTEKLPGEIYRVDCYEGISPCLDCGACKYGECVFDDKLSYAVKNIESFDLIVVATPLHYNQPSAPLLGALSRFQIMYHKNKKTRSVPCVVIITGGGNFVINSADAEKTLRIALRGINGTISAYIRSLSTDTIPAHKDEAAIRQTETVAKMIKEKRL